MDSLRLTNAMGIHPKKVRVSGGGTRSALWRQIMADIFGIEVATVNVTQGAAYGAALLAAVGAGAFSSVSNAIDATVKETSITQPGPDREMYEACHERFRALYPALADSFRHISSMPI